MSYVNFAHLLFLSFFLLPYVFSNAKPETLIEKSVSLPLSLKREKQELQKMTMSLSEAPVFVIYPTTISVVQSEPTTSSSSACAPARSSSQKVVAPRGQM